MLSARERESFADSVGCHLALTGVDYRPNILLACAPSKRKKSRDNYATALTDFVRSGMLVRSYHVWQPPHSATDKRIHIYTPDGFARFTLEELQLSEPSKLYGARLAVFSLSPEARATYSREGFEGAEYPPKTVALLHVKGDEHYFKSRGDWHHSLPFVARLYRFVLDRRRALPWTNCPPSVFPFVRPHCVPHLSFYSEHDHMPDCSLMLSDLQTSGVVPFLRCGPQSGWDYRKANRERTTDSDRDEIRTLFEYCCAHLYIRTTIDREALT